MTPLTRLAVAAINAYQNHLSGKKGYRCAHSVLHGGSGCSGAVRQQVLARGLVGALGPVLARFASCASAERRLRDANGGMRVRGVCCCNGIPIPLP